jgi:hypothetical protein
MRICILVATLLPIALCGCSNLPTTEVQLNWAGTTIAETWSTEDAASPIGGVSRPSAWRLDKLTSKISASIGSRFGIEYAFLGQSSDKVSHRVVWHLPNGGFTDPATNRTTTTFVSDNVCVTGLRCYAGYRMGGPWELVSGTWVVEVWKDDRRLLRHEFEVSTHAYATTQPAQPRAHDQPETRVSLRTLTVEDALTLASTDGFASAADLAALRPTPKRDLIALEFDVVSGDVAARSAMRFTPLPAGLQHVSHSVRSQSDVAFLNESFVDVYGITSVLYWSSRFVQDDIPLATVPDKVRLLKGRPFSTTSGYILERSQSNGDVYTMECVPVEELRASAIHADLPGLATLFSCEESPSHVVVRLWYLPDAERYVVSETEVDGHLQSRFKITGVTFR